MKSDIDRYQCWIQIDIPAAHPMPMVAPSGHPVSWISACSLILRSALVPDLPVTCNQQRTIALLPHQIDRSERKGIFLLQYFIISIVILYKNYK